MEQLTWSLWLTLSILTLTVYLYFSRKHATAIGVLAEGVLLSAPFVLLDYLISR